MSKKTSTVSRTADKVWTLSNIMSMSRVLLVIPMVFLMQDARNNQHWILIIGVAAYVSDLLDGWLARHLGDESKLGRIIDPLADKVFITITVIMMIVVGLIPLWFAIIVVMRDILIFLGGMHLRKASGVLVQSNTLGKIAVVSVVIVLVTALFSIDRDSTALLLAMIISLGLLTASLYSYGERYVRLLRGARKK